MRLLVAVKRVVDYAAKIRVQGDKRAVDISSVKMAINPLCEVGVEEAVRLKEKGVVNEVVAVSIGPKQCAETLRTSMAMGADKAIHVHTDMRADQEMQPLGVAKILRAIVNREKFDLVVLGKQAIDDDANQTGQMLAGLLGWPQATFASKLEVDADKSSMKVTREIDGGLQTIRSQLPAVLTCDLRLNQPRYSSLPNIMKARKKPLETIALEELGVDTKPRLTIQQVETPPPRKAGLILESVDELVDKLKNEAGVI